MMDRICQYQRIKLADSIEGEVKVMSETEITLKDVEQAMRKLIIKLCEESETHKNSATIIAIAELKRTLLFN